MNMRKVLPTLVLTLSLANTVGCDLASFEREPPQGVGGDSTLSHLTPEPGAVNLVFEGAINRTIDDVGAECSDWGTEDFDLLLRSRDIEGPDSLPLWNVAVGHFGRGQPQLTANLVIDSELYTVPISELRESAFLPFDAGAHLDLIFDRAGTDGTTVRGTVTCQRYDTGVPVPNHIVDVLREASGAEPRRYATYDFGRSQDPQSASVIVSEARAETLIDGLRARLPAGWVSFEGTSRWLGDEVHQGVEVVVGPGSDQFDILRLARSDAVNYDMGTEALVRKLQDYDRQVGIQILIANTDTVVFSLRSAPADYRAFAEDLYEFCPDIVDQGFSTLDELEADLQRTQWVGLWWD